LIATRLFTTRLITPRLITNHGVLVRQIPTNTPSFTAPSGSRHRRRVKCVSQPPRIVSEAQTTR
jgi:hypothetical protein